MSTPFTTVAGAGGTGLRDIFNLTFLTEIYDAFAERAVFSSYPLEVEPFEAGDDLQVLVGGQGWYGYQEYLATHLVPRFIPVKDDYTGLVLAPYQSNDRQFFIDAGITPEGSATFGFRRATSWDPETDDWTDISDPMFSYGLMQKGDIIGPWIMVDLQNALSALKNTVKSVTLSPATGHRRTSEMGYYYSTCEQSRSVALASWSAAAWTNYAAAGKYVFYARRATLSPTYWVHEAERQYRKYTRSADAFFSSAGRPLTVDFYAIQTGTPSPDFPAIGPGQSILIQSNIVAGGTVGIKVDTDPILVFGWTCPFDPGSTVSISMEALWVVRHDPTHCNG